MGIKQYLLGEQSVSKKEKKQLDEMENWLMNLENFKNDEEILNEKLLGIAKVGTVVLQFTNSLKQIKSAETFFMSAKGGINSISDKSPIAPLKPVLTPVLDGLSSIAQAVRSLLIINSVSAILTDRTMKKLTGRRT